MPTLLRSASPSICCTHNWVPFALLLLSWLLVSAFTVIFTLFYKYSQLIVSLVLCWFIGKVLVKRQTVYQKATQDRINFTSEVLGSIKAVKMLGYTERFTDLLEDKRDQDLNVGKHYREMIVWANAVGKLIHLRY